MFWRDTAEGRAWSRSEVRGYAAFLQNAKNVAGWIPRVGTLGWYAMPRQGIESEMWSGPGIGNVIVPFALVGK